MREAFLQLSRGERAAILQTLAGKLGRTPQVLEKDVWVCWALQELFSMPDRLQMAFKGGTSLSKVFGAIRRFSLKTWTLRWITVRSRRNSTPLHQA